jgi:hypothetical protein
MSQIQKVAVSDARLMQDDPVYAVQRGAQSISVAPFAAISASQSQMTFQILVPSLNVFIDRKILLATPLSFTANLFYSGPRGVARKDFLVLTAASAGTSSTGALTISTAGLLNTATVTDYTKYFAFAGATLFGPTLPPGCVITNVTSSSTTAATFYFTSGITPTTSALYFAFAPATFDVPDPSQGQAVAGGTTVGGDNGLCGASSSDSFQQQGWASAVGGKDLAWTQFPVQSALTNMTATLNDCTVTTNGDTLREQIMLTSSQETFKQRTCPTNPDVFSWGRDDVQNGSGNFSTYGVVNQTGDIPNGAWPTAWSADAACTNPLFVAGKTPTVLSVGAPGTSATYPFIAASTTNATGPYSFMSSAAVASCPGSASAGGIGFYVAPFSTNVTLGQSSAGTTYTPSNVIVPFVNNQPVWTCGFPGGDLLGVSFNTRGAAATAGVAPAFMLSDSTAAGNTLTLLKDVPGMSMIGARLYNVATGTSAITASGVTTGVFGIVTACTGGALGAVGSTYTIFTANGLTWSSASAPGNCGLAGSFPLFGLSGGCVTGTPLPVSGTVCTMEPLVISPLIWADSAEFQTVGLYGMTNMQFVLNFAPLGTTRAILNSALTTPGLTLATRSLPYWVDDLSQNNPNTGNILRSSGIRTMLSDLSYAPTGSASGPWAGQSKITMGTNAAVPTLYATFLTPNSDTNLPEVSTVPYTEFPRYFYSVGQQLALGDNAISSQTISLTSIPDMVMVFVKPATRGPTQLDQYLPIKSVSVTFDNYSNLCSSFQQSHLYECAVAAGLDMDWQQWRGFTQAQYPSAVYPSTSSSATSLSPFTQTSGGPILLRFGQDITLQQGLAPGCLGNYSFQITVTVDNSKGFYTYLGNTIITIVAINSGFFETMRGQSAIRKTILQMSDVAAATPDSGVSKTHLNRMVGRGHHSRGQSNMLHNAVAHLAKAKGLSDLTGALGMRHGTYGDDSMLGMAQGAVKRARSGLA